MPCRCDSPRLSGCTRMDSEAPAYRNKEPTRFGRVAWTETNGPGFPRQRALASLVQLLGHGLGGARMPFLNAPASLWVCLGCSKMEPIRRALASFSSVVHLESRMRGKR